MGKFGAAAVTAGLLLLGFVAPARASVIFDFFETSLTSCHAGTLVVPCHQPSQPLAIVSITLSNPNEIGSAAWAGPLHMPYTPPVVTDPGFVFRDLFSPSVTIAPPDFGAPSFCPACTDFLTGYSISWTELTSQLAAINIGFTATFDEVFLGLNGGTIGSDGIIGTCGATVCDVVGYWQRVPEPGSAMLLLSALLLIGAARWRRYPRV